MKKVLFKKFKNKCKFGYPIQHESKTRIEFTETKNTVRAEIFLKRNDQFSNIYNRTICNEWRANIDMQIILDHSAAIHYMVKYITKGEKAGKMLTNLFKDVCNNSKEEDNPQTKLRSLMIKQICGKRDIGQCEVSRLLMSEPLYHSDFKYVSISTDLDSREINCIRDLDETQPTTKSSLIDYYSKRNSNPFLEKYLNLIVKYLEFGHLFSINKNKLVINNDADKTVVITLP